MILLKGDISGIQDFIFNVKSDGASQALKSRSFYIQTLAVLCLEKAREYLKPYGIGREINGGGVFYLELGISEQLVDQKKLIKEVKALTGEINAELTGMGIFVAFTIAEGVDHSSLMKGLSQKSGVAKLRKHVDSHLEFTPFDHLTSFKGDTQKLIKAKGFEITSFPPDSKKAFCSLGGIHFIFSDNNQQLTGRLSNRLPVWSLELMETYATLIEEIHQRELESHALSNDQEDPPRKPEAGHLINFHYLAGFAAARTGTEKIGVLKMDVDSLGTCFGVCKDLDSLKAFSGLFVDFFDKELYQLWHQGGLINPKDDIKHAYVNNIYTVFAGGDDCFFVGAWDAIAVFAIEVRQKFQEFQAGLDEKITEKKVITLSAGLQIFPPKFPVAKFAEITESALEEAKQCERKTADGSLKMKDAISFMGEVFPWEGFDKLVKVKDFLLDLIVSKGESKSILHTIKAMAPDEPVYGQARQLPEVWKLDYKAKRNVSPDHFPAVQEQVVEVYDQALMDYWMNGNNRSAAMAFPMAAYWTELLIKDYGEVKGKK